jgi:hypothetical protein
LETAWFRDIATTSGVMPDADGSYTIPARSGGIMEIDGRPLRKKPVAYAAAIC